MIEISDKNNIPDRHDIAAVGLVSSDDVWDMFLPADYIFISSFLLAFKLFSVYRTENSLDDKVSSFLLNDLMRRK